MIYEMIIYHCEQRNSCTESLTPLERFKSKIQAYWEDHRMHLVDSWTVTLGDYKHELYYVSHGGRQASRGRSPTWR